MKRRRFLAISAAVGMLAASPARAFRLDPVQWRGTAMGAAASLTIHHENRGAAEAALAASLAEIERLERIFSLYREDSVLRRLNAGGRIDHPPADLLALLSEADRLWRLSEGAFDPTVQPLWEHFAKGAAPSAELLPLIGWENVVVTAECVWFRRPGMAITLNGIAQGYVTDRVTELLRAHGLRHVLANLGEIRALGTRGDGAPWTVGLAGIARGLRDEALAVSSAEATRLSPSCHHLFDPRTGRSAANLLPVAVAAPSATLADGLSTACAVSFGQRDRLVARAGARLVL